MHKFCLGNELNKIIIIVMLSNGRLTLFQVSRSFYMACNVV